MFIPFSVSLTEATFVRRINRFVAEVELDGDLIQVHVPNTGRMAELLVAGHSVCLLPAQSATRKTKYDLVLVRYGATWVCVDSRQANVVAYRLFKQLAAGNSDRLPEPDHPLWANFVDITEVKREATRGGHRFDFRLQRGKQTVWVEVKSVNLVVDGEARFPDAPTQRGRDHVCFLADLIEDGDEAHVLFVVQREDGRSFAPNWEMDPAFATALQEAAERGVYVNALGLRMTPEGAYVETVLPVNLGQP